MSRVDSQQILIVEDDDDTRHSMCDALASLGYITDSVTTAGDALSNPVLPEAAIILLDRVLPDATAEELLPQLKKLAPDCSVIVITGHGDLDTAIACLRLGATDYLLKPVDVDVLQESIDRVLTTRHMNEQKLQTTRLAAITEAMTGLSHECRNALQRGQASLDMLMDELSDNPNAVRLVERIQVSQDDLQRLYEDVKAYAAPILLTPSVCRVDEIVQQTWAELSSQRNGFPATLTESSDTSSTEVVADPSALRMVFRNLLENALAAHDGVSIEVSYRDATVSGKAALLITISNDGPGIGADVGEHVFDEFFTTRMRGTGLGLPICRRLVEAHRGRIELGNPELGTEVRVTLPRS